MSDLKRGDRYYGMALKRKARLTEVENKLSCFAIDAEKISDELLEKASKLNDSKLLQLGNRLGELASSTLGWLEG